MTKSAGWKRTKTARREITAASEYLGVWKHRFGQFIHSARIAKAKQYRRTVDKLHLSDKKTVVINMTT